MESRLGVILRMLLSASPSWPYTFLVMVSISASSFFCPSHCPFFSVGDVGGVARYPSSLLYKAPGWRAIRASRAAILPALPKTLSASVASEGSSAPVPLCCLRLKWSDIILIHTC